MGDILSLEETYAWVVEYVVVMHALGVNIRLPHSKYMDDKLIER